MDGEIEELDIAEQIEIERTRLDISKCTPVTEERLKEWMATRKKQRDAEIEAERAAAAKKSSGRVGQALSGRSLFQLDPSLFKDDDDAADDDVFTINKKDLPQQPEEEEKAEALYGEDDGEDVPLEGGLTLEDGTEIDTSLFE